MLDRRTFLTILAAAGLAPSLARGRDIPAPVIARGPAQPFDETYVKALAKGLSLQAFKAPAQIPQAWRNIDYDTYKNILFDQRSAVFRGLPFEADLFAPGLYFTQGVDLYEVADGQAAQIEFAKSAFTYTDQVPDLPEDPALGFSGFRLRHPINSQARKEEFLVMQGASYFRAVGRDQFYGLSARGLALGTGSAEGEEFPFYRAIWLEQPAPDAKQMVLHALLDSPSVAGAFRFTLFPGTAETPETRIDVDCTLYPRVPLDRVGIAPLTSMFLYDETNRSRFDDFRPAVHDSDGLFMVNGQGEHLWRKLANPAKLEISSFVDDDPRGFGLMQRPRKLSDYADLEARYERRPSLWVEPRAEPWGPGAITLVEIPADKEIYDNIVAFWTPREPLQPGGEHRFVYNLYWGGEPQIGSTKARVLETAIGGKPFDERPGALIVAIDFADHQSLPRDLSRLTLHVSSSRGEVSKGIVNRNPETGGVRLDFTVLTEGVDAIDLRAQLLLDRAPVSEVWMYRWTRTPA